MKIKKKYFLFFRGGGEGWVLGGGGFGPGWGGCEQRSEAFVKIQKKICFFWGVGRKGVRLEGGGGGQGGCERRSEVFVKIQKKIFFLGGGSGGEGGDVRSGVGWGRGVAMFGVGG